MQIHGFNKLTLLDYPGHLAATIILGGCNMRCPFCHNASLVTRAATVPTIAEDEVLSYLMKRRNILEGICITGGEPTLYPELPLLIAKIKELGYRVKLDTNGTNPAMLKSLAKDHFIDYVAMDIKNSKIKYPITSGNSILNIDFIVESIRFLIDGSLDYEFRTTLVKELHNEEDMHSIGDWIKEAKAYYLQSYQDSDDILSPGYHSHTKDMLSTFVSILEKYIHNVTLRGVD